MYFVLMEIQLPKPIYIFAVVLNINETSFTHKLELFDSLVLFLSRFFPGSWQQYVLESSSSVSLSLKLVVHQHCL